MGKVNGLSRRLDWKVGTNNNNSNQTLIKEARSKNEKVFRVVEKIKKTGVKILQGDLVFKGGNIYVLKDEELRGELIWLHHNIPVVENRGR